MTNEATQNNRLSWYLLFALGVVALALAGHALIVGGTDAAFIAFVVAALVMVGLMFGVAVTVAAA